MMGQAVQQGPGQLLAAKHLWPLREVRVYTMITSMKKY